jgi:hypothetical protein
VLPRSVVTVCPRSLALSFAILVAGADYAVGQNACLDKCQAEANACADQVACDRKKTECLANCKGDLRCTRDCLLAFKPCIDPCFTKLGACQAGCGQ